MQGSLTTGNCITRDIHDSNLGPLGGHGSGYMSRAATTQVSMGFPCRQHKREGICGISQGSEKRVQQIHIRPVASV